MILLLFGLLMIGFPTQAAVFKWVDEYGQVHFSDKSHQDATRLELHIGQSYYSVDKVYDGDSILLSSGDKVRLLSINTPEVAGRNTFDQKGGEQAKQWLIQQLQNKKVYLEKDFERKDKYGRILAHVFTEDKLHLNLELVKQGLATTSIYPPSIKYIKALVHAENQAEKQRLGLWGYRDYKPKKATKIPSKNAKGWQRIRGKVKKITRKRKYSYLTLTKQVFIKISHDSEPYFPQLNRYLGQKIEVRGWVRKYKDEFHILVRHHSALKVLN